MDHCMSHCKDDYIALEGIVLEEPVCLEGRLDKGFVVVQAPCRYMALLVAVEQCDSCCFAQAAVCTVEAAAVDSYCYKRVAQYYSPAVR